MYSKNIVAIGGGGFGRSLGSLYTEASLISYELFLKNEWEIIRKEKVIINNIFFERYKMTKIIKIY